MVNHWSIAQKFTQSLIATANTRYRPTRKTKMSSMRHGVLSVMQFGLLMDESSKEIVKKNLGIQPEGLDKLIGYLLWVDDVMLAEMETTNSKECLISQGILRKNTVINKVNLKVM